MQQIVAITAPQFIERISEATQLDSTREHFRATSAAFINSRWCGVHPAGGDFHGVRSPNGSSRPSPHKSSTLRGPNLWMGQACVRSSHHTAATVENFLRDSLVEPVVSVTQLWMIDFSSTVIRLTTLRFQMRQHLVVISCAIPGTPQKKCGVSASFDAMAGYEGRYTELRRYFHSMSQPRIWIVHKFTPVPA